MLIILKAPIGYRYIDRIQGLKMDRWEFVMIGRFRLEQRDASISRDVLTVGSTMRIPLLYRGEYSQWSEKFMNYLEEQTDGEAMINSIKNGDQPLPRVTQVSLARTSSTKQPPLKDKSMWKAAVLYEYETFKATERELLLNTYIRYLQYATIMRQNKNLLDINIDALYDILKKNQGDEAKVSKRKVKVVVFSKSEGSDDELKKITALLDKDFNRKKFYSKPTNNNLRTSSATSSANKKQEYVKFDDKKEEKKVDKKKRDMSKVKCYNYKKEGHFAKDCKKAKVKDYEYYKTKMLLAKKDKDKKVLLAKDQAWMESSSDSDQKINANMVFMAQIKKVHSDSEVSSSSSDDMITETMILEKIIIDLEDEVVSLLEKEKANLETIESLKSKGFESSENVISESKNQSENDCQVVEKGCDQVENSKVIAPGMFKIMKSSTTNVETSNVKISLHEEEFFHESSESFQEESSSSSFNNDVQQSLEEVRVPLSNTQSVSNNIVLNVDEATNVAEALRDADWINAMQDELDQFARSKTAFLNGILKEKVYVGQPTGFVSKQYPDHVYALDKALYGLKQAPRAWYDVLSQFLIESCFQKGSIDTALFIKKKVPTPMVEQAKLKLALDGKPVDHTDYQSMIGSLITVCPFLQQNLKYVAVSGCCAQVFWMRTQLTDYGFFYDKVPIYCDSKSAIAISCNPVQHTRTKHIDVRYHFIKDRVKKGTIELYFVGTEYQLADLFTKSLPKARFKFLIEKLGMMSREI
nr:ribonuclease H [Tanacetum cinerariifolium]